MNPIVWLSGLSGAGKSTLASLTQQRLQAKGWRVGILDGDAVRRTVNRRLGFTRQDIEENNRLIAEMCCRQRGQWDLLLVAVISPFESCRRMAQARLGGPFALVYVKASLSTVMARDPKGFYRKAREGIVKNMIGCSPDVPYEVPEQPDMVLDTETESEDRLALQLAEFIQDRFRDVKAQ